MTIEQIIIDYLAAQDIEGIGANVYGETPVDPPTRYVTVRRAGGDLRNHIRNPRIVTETCSRESLLDAAEHHELVLSAMLQIRNHTPLYGCRLNNDYNATRPNTKTYAYQALWQATM